MKRFLWLLPLLLLAVSVVPTQAQNAARKKHDPTTQDEVVFATQTAFMCNSMVFDSLTGTEKAVTRRRMSPTKRAELDRWVPLTRRAQSLQTLKQTRPRLFQAQLAAMPDPVRNANLQLLQALPAAQTCAASRVATVTGGGGGGGGGGTSNPPVNPSCTTSSTVDTNCPCNSLTVQDTRTDPTTSAKCCCNAATNPCSSDSTCSAPVEWMFLAGTGLLLGGRYLGKWRRRPVAA
jgi:hypothetical protein